MAQLKVEVLVGLVDRLTKPLARMGRNLRRTGAELSMIGAGAAYGGRQLLMPLQGSVQAAIELQSELTEVAIVADKTAGEVGKIRPLLRDLAAEYGEDQLAITQALGLMTAKGLGFEQAAAALPDATKAAAALKAEIGDTARVSTALVASLKIDPAQLSDPFNRMAAAAAAGGFEVRDMAEYFPQLAASMAKLYTGSEAVGTLSAMLQVIEKRAGSAGQAATQAGDLMEKMFAPATVTALEKKFGVDLPAALQKWRDEGKNVFDEFIAMVQDVTDGDQFKIGQIFGDKEARAALVSLTRHWEEFEQVRAAANAAPAQDVIGQMFDQRLAEDATLRLKRIRESVDNLKIILGEALLPVINTLSERLGPLLDKMQTWIEASPRIASNVTLAVAALGALGVVLGPIIMGLGLLAGGAGLLAGGLGRVAAFAGLAGKGLGAIKVGALASATNTMSGFAGAAGLIPAATGKAAAGVRGLFAPLARIKAGGFAGVIHGITSRFRAWHWRCRSPRQAACRACCSSSGYSVPRCLRCL
jgi:TP901 family phage tail tape measure protein